MESVIRLLPYAIADGAMNMAADETLVRTAAESGIASLRFYGWTEATLSLGYFQPAAVRFTNPRLAPLPFVRRPSGGATLVHHHELTYCLALPRGKPWQGGESWMPRMHRIITTALANHGLSLEAVQREPINHGEVLCFQQHTIGDLVSGGRKVVGSAQRKVRQALMQHGSILLAQSEHTPELPGIRELAGKSLSAAELADAIVAAFETDTGWAVEKSDWSEIERTEIARLAVDKYGTAGWNERR